MRKLTLLLCALLAGISLAVAQTSISGTVLSAENDEPVIGASILVKGANASTITDTDGKFTIKIPAGASRTLVISYIGMEKQEVFARNGMVVKLNSADHTLDDVVVVGYQTIRKEAKTGSIATVDGDDLASIPETSVDKMLSVKWPVCRFRRATGNRDLWLRFGCAEPVLSAPVTTLCMWSTVFPWKAVM